MIDHFLLVGILVGFYRDPDVGLRKQLTFLMFTWISEEWPFSDVHLLPFNCDQNFLVTFSKTVSIGNADLMVIDLLQFNSLFYRSLLPLKYPEIFSYPSCYSISDNVVKVHVQYIMVLINFNKLMQKFIDFFDIQYVNWFPCSYSIKEFQRNFDNWA